MNAALCEAFCEELEALPVGAGLIVNTPFEGANGERLGFTIVRDAEDPTLFRLEDDGPTISLLEADGIDFGTDARPAVLTELLAEYRVSYDTDLTTFVSASVTEEQVYAAALRRCCCACKISHCCRRSVCRTRSGRMSLAKIKAQIGSRAAVWKNEAVS